MPLKLGPINKQVEDMARSVTAEERRERFQEHLDQGVRDHGRGDIGHREGHG